MPYFWLLSWLYYCRKETSLCCWVVRAVVRAPYPTAGVLTTLLTTLGKGAWSLYLSTRQEEDWQRKVVFVKAEPIWRCGGRGDPPPSSSSFPFPMLYTKGKRRQVARRGGGAGNPAQGPRVGIERYSTACVAGVYLINFCKGNLSYSPCV